MYNIVGITLFCLKTKITFDYWYFETQKMENTNMAYFYNMPFTNYQQ